MYTEGGGSVPNPEDRVGRAVGASALSLTLAFGGHAGYTPDQGDPALLGTSRENFTVGPKVSRPNALDNWVWGAMSSLLGTWAKSSILDRAHQ